MENEHQHYGLRSGSRSRSQTPLVPNRALVESEILEHHYDLRRRSRERSHTPGEVTNNRKSGFKSLLGSSSKTNDQNMETLTERKKENTTSETLSEGESKRPDNSFIATKKVERRSERQKVKRQTFTNGQTDNKQDSSGRKNEKNCKSTSPRRILTSDYSSEEGEREDLSNRPSSAHEIYKQAGDWWNVFPKTDYTYSQQSQCRYEIAPGILAMPNMSRRSIHSDAENFNNFSHSPSESNVYETANIGEEKETKAERYTFTDKVHESHTSNSDAKSKIQYTKTHVEQYCCHREAIFTVPKNSTNLQSRQLLHSDSTPKCIHFRKYNVASSADSDTELEEVILNNHNEERKITRQFINLVSIIVLWFSKLLEFLKLRTVKRREYRATYEYQRHDTKWYKMWRCVDRSLQHVYLFMVKVFFFDSWLLSRVSSVRRWMNQRSPKVFWVALLPLLLLTGAYFVQKQSFICLDSLHNVPYDVTETSYRIFNDIISLTPFQRDLFNEYLKTIKNLSVYFLSSVNVSLPEMP